MSNATLAVLGPGGVGGFLAAALHRAGEPVVVVAREPTARVIERDGLRVSSHRLGDFRATPRAVPSLDETVEVLFVAAKAPALAEALERIGREPELVVPLLNGLDHMAVLRDRFSAPVIAGSIRIEAQSHQVERRIDAQLMKMRRVASKPESGDQVRLAHLLMRVDSMRGRRVDRVRLKLVSNGPGENHGHALPPAGGPG